MRRPMLNNSSPGDAVYDPFLGSGTTLIAAQTANRVCFSIEIDPLYVDVAIRRWQAFTGEHATRLADCRPFAEIAASGRPVGETGAKAGAVATPEGSGAAAARASAPPVSAAARATATSPRKKQNQKSSQGPRQAPRTDRRAGNREDH
jgi:hypothetical protein